MSLKTIYGQAYDIHYKNSILESYYAYKHKGPVVVKYTVIGKNEISRNIKIRPYWKTLKLGHPAYRVYGTDYKYSGYDIGHLAFDSAFDYSITELRKTYMLGLNSVPQTPTFNRYYWKKLERHIKELSVLHGMVNVTDIITYSEVKIGACVSVPKDITAILEYAGKIETYRYPNVRKFTEKNNIEYFKIQPIMT